MERDDRVLAADAKAGDRKAFDELVRLNKDKMFALVYRMTGDREAALDLLQDTFFTAFKQLARFRGESQFSSWLYSIASRKTLNYLSRKKLLSFLPLGGKEMVEPSYNMADNIESSEIDAGIAKAVNSLPPKQKMVFTLRFYDQLAFAEIAEILGKSVSTVKTNYQKAIEKLQRGLKDFR